VSLRRDSRIVTAELPTKCAAVLGLLSPPQCRTGGWRRSGKRHDALPLRLALDSDAQRNRVRVPVRGWDRIAGAAISAPRLGIAAPGVAACQRPTNPRRVR